MNRPFSASGLTVYDSTVWVARRWSRDWARRRGECPGAVEVRMTGTLSEAVRHEHSR